MLRRCVAGGRKKKQKKNKEERHFKHFVVAVSSPLLGADVQGDSGSGVRAKHSVTTNKTKSKVQPVSVFFSNTMCTNGEDGEENERRRAKNSLRRRVDDKRATCDILEIQSVNRRTRLLYTSLAPFLFFPSY